MYSKTIIVGRFTDNPKFSSAGSVAVANFSVAVNNTKDNTEFYRVAAFGKLSEIVQSYMSDAKGSLVVIEGKLKSSTYKDNQGVDKTSWQLVADTIQMLGKTVHADNSAQQNAPQQQQQQYAAPNQQQYANPGIGNQQFQQQGSQQQQYNAPQNQQAPQQQQQAGFTPNAAPWTPQQQQNNAGPFTPNGQAMNIADDDLPF